MTGKGDGAVAKAREVLEESEEMVEGVGECIVDDGLFGRVRGGDLAEVDGGGWVEPLLREAAGDGVRHVRRQFGKVGEGGVLVGGARSMRSCSKRGPERDSVSTCQ